MRSARFASVVAGIVVALARRSVRGRRGRGGWGRRGRESAAGGCARARVPPVRRLDGGGVDRRARHRVLDGRDRRRHRRGRRRHVGRRLRDVVGERAAGARGEPPRRVGDDGRGRGAVGPHRHGEARGGRLRAAVRDRRRSRDARGLCPRRKRRTDVRVRRADAGRIRGRERHGRVRPEPLPDVPARRSTRRPRRRTWGRGPSTPCSRWTSTTGDRTGGRPGPTWARVRRWTGSATSSTT